MMLKKVIAVNFNSQPHEEADNNACIVAAVYNISTHSLTKRLTVYPKPYEPDCIISTHSLTKRLTSKRP